MRHEVKGGFSDYEMTLVSFILMEMDTMLQFIRWIVKDFEWLLGN